VAVTKESSVGPVGLEHPSVSAASPIVVVKAASSATSSNPTRLFSVLLAGLRPVVRPEAARATTSTPGPCP